MRRLLLAITLLALGAGLALGARALAQDGDGLPPGRYVVIGAILYDKQTGQEVYVYNASGYATATPRPPMATETPHATDTPEPPTASLTPTRETGITPSPTSPTTKACLATTSAALNLRSDHNATASILDNIDPSARMEVLSFWVIEDVTDEWLQVRVLARSGQTRIGWVFRGESVYVGVDDTEELCWDVPVDGPGTVPTPAPTATPVPGPTATPVSTEPAPDNCTYSHVYTMTIRSGPGTNYSRVGSLPAGVPAIVGHLYPNTTTEQWAFVTYAGTTGWVAVKTGGVAYGSLTGNCSGVRRDQPRLELNTAVGIRTVPGAEDFTVMYPVLKAKGIPYGVSPYASMDYCLDALDQGGICVYRPGWPDCPDNRGIGDPRAAAREFMKHAEFAANTLKGYENVWIEPTNECNHTPMSDELMVWWRDFYDEYIDQAVARGWPPLALPGLPPGHGDAHMFRIWKPMLEKLKAHGGLFSMHAYTFNSKTGLCVFDEWEAARFTRNYKLMRDEGYEIPITITEAARWAGEAPVDVGDMVCFVNKTRELGYIHSVWLWVGGHHPAWPLANLDGHYAEIAERIG